jgi:lipoprotein-anchoring transpeptidase ErfK/SrfK
VLVCLLAAGLASADVPAVESGPLSPIVMELESSTFELHVRDARDGMQGPTIRVALGSPGQSTPTGAFPLERIILSPSWRPGVMAKLTGAEPEEASLNTPMGAVKIPFAMNGVIALHGGGDERSLGKRISAGCIRATDADLLRIVAWLDGQDALTAATEVQNGEIHRRFRRPIQLVVR